MPGHPDKPTIFPGQNPDLRAPTGNTTPPERGFTRRSRKLQGGFPPLSHKDLTNGPQTVISADELAQIPASFVTVGGGGVSRTYRSIAEIVRKRNGTTTQRREPAPEANLDERMEPEKPLEPVLDNEDIAASSKTVEADLPVLQKPSEAAEVLPSFDVFGNGRPHPGFGRRRRLMPDEISHLPPSLTIARGKYVLGFVDAVGKNPRQNPFMPKETPLEVAPIEHKSKSRKDKPKREFVFTEIPPELTDTYRRILLKLGFRNPDTQRYTRQLKDIAAEVAPGHEGNSNMRYIISRVASLMHPSISPDAEESVLTPKQIAVISKDPVGYMALNIMQLAQNTGVSIPRMKYRVVEGLTLLHDEHEAVRPPIRRSLAKPVESQ